MDSKCDNRGEEETWVKEGPKQTLEEMLERWRKKEELTKANKVNCKTCGNRQNTERNLVVIEGPAILIIQLKRWL